MMPTNFSQLIGNDTIKTYLTRMIDRKAISHSLLFAGPEGIGKSLFGHVLAAKVMGESHWPKIEKGQHPDLHIYRPEGKIGLHSIQAMRQLSEEVYLPPYEAAWKVFIIHEADRMLSYSANALLKTFEEPPPQTIIILSTHNPRSLLPTLLSRCRVLHFYPLAAHEIQSVLKTKYGLDDEASQKIAILAQGSLSRACKLVERKGDSIRELTLHLLAGGRLASYKALTTAIQRLTEQVENAKKQVEESAKQEIYKTPMDHLSVSQQHLLEKELEGVVSVNFMQDAYAILQNILAWYRDMHLIHLKGKESYLIHQDYKGYIEQALQRGELLPLDYVQKVLDEAHLGLQRSTSLSICLENLFLKLKWLDKIE